MFYCPIRSNFAGLHVRVRRLLPSVYNHELQEEAERTVKNLEIRLAESLEVNEAHQKINGKLQQRVTELEEDNKKLAHEIEDRVHKMRKSGL